MPLPAPRVSRNISPDALVSGVSATSTVKAWEAPSAVTTVSGARGSSAAQAATTATSRAAPAAAAAKGACRIRCSVRRRNVGAGAVRPDLGRHLALRSVAEAHQHRLSRPQLCDAEAAQRLHVDEDVLGAL